MHIAFETQFIYVFELVCNSDYFKTDYVPVKKYFILFWKKCELF